MAQDIYNEVAVAAIDLLGFKKQVYENINDALTSIELLRKSSREHLIYIKTPKIYRGTILNLAPPLI